MDHTNRGGGECRGGLSLGLFIIIIRVVGGEGGS